MNKNSYLKFGLMMLTSFVVMYILTYVAVNTVSDIAWFSTRSLYMALVMVAPMIAIMLAFMGSMYKNKKANALLYSISVIIFIGAFFFIQKQVFVHDTAFLQSMIPHHSSAITMCEEASLTDPEVIELCQNIVEAQQREIDQMNKILERL